MTVSCAFILVQLNKCVVLGVVLFCKGGIVVMGTFVCSELGYVIVVSLPRPMEGKG